MVTRVLVALPFFRPRTSEQVIRRVSGRRLEESTTTTRRSTRRRRKIVKNASAKRRLLSRCGRHDLRHEEVPRQPCALSEEDHDAPMLPGDERRANERWTARKTALLDRGVFAPRDRKRRGDRRATLNIERTATAREKETENKLPRTHTRAFLRRARCWRKRDRSEATKNRARTETRNFTWETGEKRGTLDRTSASSGHVRAGRNERPRDLFHCETSKWPDSILPIEKPESGK